MGGGAQARGAAGRRASEGKEGKFATVAAAPEAGGWRGGGRGASEGWAG